MKVNGNQGIKRKNRYRPHMHILNKICLLELMIIYNDEFFEFILKKLCLKLICSLKIFLISLYLFHRVYLSKDRHRASGGSSLIQKLIGSIIIIVPLKKLYGTNRKIVILFPWQNYKF
jgi:hypothetical protein